MMLLIYILIAVVVFYWQLDSFRSGKSGKGKAVALYLAYTIAPVLLYVIVFMALVGIEELTGRAIIGEGYARALIPLSALCLALSLLSTLIFAVVVMVIKRRDNDST